MVKIHISYTADDEATVAQAVAYLKGILPPSKVKKKPGKPPIIACISSLKMPQSLQNSPVWT